MSSVAEILICFSRQLVAQSSSNTKLKDAGAHNGHERKTYTFAMTCERSVISVHHSCDGSPGCFKEIWACVSVRACISRHIDI